MGERQRREFHEALLEAASFEDLAWEVEAAILKAEQNRPKLRVVTGRIAREAVLPVEGRSPSGRTFRR